MVELTFHFFKTCVVVQAKLRCIVGNLIYFTDVRRVFCWHFPLLNWVFFRFHLIPFTLPLKLLKGWFVIIFLSKLSKFKGELTPESV